MEKEKIKAMGCACKASKEIKKTEPRLVISYDCVCDNPFIKGEHIGLKRLSISY